MPDMDRIELVTIITAVVGAVTGTFATALTLYAAAQDRRARRRVVVTSADLSCLGLIDGATWAIGITARNPGERTVTLQSGYLLIDGVGKYFARPIVDVDLPHDLEEGKSVTLYFRLAEILTAAIDAGSTERLEIRGEFESAIGTRYTQVGTLFVPISTWTKLLSPAHRAKIEPSNEPG